MNKITDPLLFSLGFNGKLFEPRSEIFYDKIVKAFEKEFTLNNRGFWIGAKYAKYPLNEFRDISTKKKPMKTIRLEDRNTYDFCVWADSGTRMKDWRPKPCSWTYPGTICEITE